MKNTFKTINSRSDKLLLLSGLCVNLLLASVFPYVIWSYLATIIYGAVLSSIYKDNPIALLIFSPVIVVQASALFALNAIESGAFMFEMGRIGYASSAGAAYGLIICVFILIASKIFSWILDFSKSSINQTKESRQNFIFTKCAPLLVACCIAWLLVKGVTTGFPLFDGMDRFLYRQNFGDPVTLNVLNLKIVLAAFLGLSASNCIAANEKHVHHALFLGYILSSFLFGDKFFSIIVSCVIYLTILVGASALDIKSLLRRLVIPTLGIVFSAFVVTSYIYSDGGTYGFDDTLKLMLDRFASQGQLWFIAYNENFRWLDFETDEVLSNIQSLVNTPHQDYVFDNSLSAFHFVTIYAPSNMVQSFMSNNGFVAPTGVYEAYAMELFGFIGSLISIVLAGMLYGLIGWSIWRAIHKSNPFSILLPAYILVQFYYLIVSGTPYNVFGLSAIKAYIAIYMLNFFVGLWITVTSKANIASNTTLQNAKF